MNKERAVLDVGESKVAFTRFTRSDYSNVCAEKGTKSLLLLHGAGVAGELTWTFIVNYLEHWDEILIPDLLGMGDSYFDQKDQETFSIKDICTTLFSLLHHFKWKEFDLAGYSLGGLVAIELNKEAAPDFNIHKMCLIEPALFSDESLQSSLQFRRQFTPLAMNIKADPSNEKHFVDFLDLVSPKRIKHPQADQLAIQRLRCRPFGFANAIHAVSQYAADLNESALNSLIEAIPPGVGVIGGLSNDSLISAQQRIQKSQSSWAIEVLPKTDHSLIYVRPKRIAQLMNQHLA